MKKKKKTTTRDGLGKRNEKRVEIVIERWTPVIVTGKIFETPLCKLKTLISLLGR